MTELEENGRRFMICAVILLATTTVAMALRLYVRRVILNTIGVDDWLLIIAYVRYTIADDVQDS